MVHGKHHGDIDVDSLSKKLLDGWNSGRGGGHLNHHIRSIYSFPKSTGLLNGFFCLLGQLRRHFQTDKSVLAGRLIEDRAEQIASSLNVFDGERFINLLYLPALGEQGLQGGIVVTTPVDGFFEDGGV